MSSWQSNESHCLLKQGMLGLNKQLFKVQHPKKRMRILKVMATLLNNTKLMFITFYKVKLIFLQIYIKLKTITRSKIWSIQVVCYILYKYLINHFLLTKQLNIYFKYSVKRA